MRWWDEECIEDGDSVITDPLLVERSKPVTDEEARRFEDICQAATPGPLVVDDKSDGSGMVVAYLPDGRSVVNQNAESLASCNAEGAAAANAELFCRARCIVLRLLRDRRDCKRREQGLLKRIDFLEAELERRQQMESSARWEEAVGYYPNRPR
jgi:hypothetical protein